MNKATTFSEWKAAMELQGLPMMNTVYADKQNIYYVYNALLPVRKEGFDWMSILPGNTSEIVWSDYLPYTQLPQVLNPPSGLVLNTNSTPFRATVGPGNPQPQDFSPTLGIETLLNNRAVRSHELFGTDESITREEFIRYKFDRRYSTDSPLYREVLRPLFDGYQPDGEDEEKALSLLKSWDGEMDEASSGATLVRLTYEPVHRAKIFKPVGAPLPKPADTFQAAVRFLKRHYGRVDVPLGTVQRLQRGKTDLALGGGTDTLNAVHTKRVGAKMVGRQGDSYILIAEFSSAGVQSWAIHQYGNVNRKDSPHYDDQAPLFVQRKLRPSLLTRTAIEQALEKSYHPGDETPGP
jgi:penicillin amidase/acyl-homoserine-lactone acylase